ncbi:hypothetical protein Dimus_002517 [Dionaea muscipula]
MYPHVLSLLSHTLLRPPPFTALSDSVISSLLQVLIWANRRTLEMQTVEDHSRAPSSRCGCLRISFQYPMPSIIDLPRIDFVDGVVSPMTLFSLPIRPLRVRASSFSIGHLHNHAYSGGSRQPLHFEVTQNPCQLWFAKVVFALCAKSQSLDSLLGYLRGRVTPPIAFEVIKRFHNPESALKFFEFSRVKLSLIHSLGTYNYLLRSLCEMGLHEAADWVFECMKSDGHPSNSYIVGFLVGTFAEAGKFDAAKKFLSVNRDGANSFVYNKYLSILVWQNRVDEAVSFFREYMGPQSSLDTCTFNILIRGLCRARQNDLAFQLFEDMGEFGCSPDIITYNSLIDGLCRSNEVDRAHGLLKEVLSRDDFSPDVITYTSMISGYCKLGKMEAASLLFSEMTTSGIKPTMLTFNILIDGFGKVDDMGSALVMLEKMLFLGCDPDVVTYSSLIDGYCRHGQVDEGLKVWQEMNRRNVSPNEYTFAILINALCKENRLNEGREFIMQLEWRNVVPQPFMYNPVIDGFCKAGKVDVANAIVSEMEQRKCKPDKITFTILIIGHCMKGRMSEAIGIFSRMLAVRCAPDTITINSFASCLLKAGMASEALQIKKLVGLDNISQCVSSSRKSFSTPTNMEIQVAV